MRETWKNSVENWSTVTATHNPQRYFGPSSVSGNVQTQRYRHTHTHIPKTPKSQYLPPVLPSCPEVPALSLLIDVISTCMDTRPGSQENPAFHGGCWRKSSSPWIKGRGPVLNDLPGKKHHGCCVIPSAGGFRPGGRGIRKTQSLPMRKTSCSLFHPGV